MVSQHITTNLFQVQVRVDDQSTYPHHMSTGFVSRGVDMGASAPCIYYKRQKSRLLSIRTCWLCVFGTDCDTHTHPVKSVHFLKQEHIGIPSHTMCFRRFCRPHNLHHKVSVGSDPVKQRHYGHPDLMNKQCPDEWGTVSRRQWRLSDLDHHNISQ